MPDRPSHPQSESVPDPASQDARLRECLSGVVAGRAGAAEELVLILEKPVRDAARAFLGFHNEEVQDVSQETCLAVLNYVRQQGGFQGNVIRFAVTISRNRCRNILNWNRRWQKSSIESLADWIEHPGRSPLDLLADDQVDQIVQQTVNALNPPCDVLLRGLYLQQRSAESLRRELKLNSVQGVYYRRDKCLKQAYQALKKRLAVCSSHADEE